MFKKIKEFFVGKPAVESKFEHPLDAVTAPYKIPEPPATTPVPLVVEVAPVPVAEVAPAKKPRKPRAPKTATVPAVKEKAPAKAKAPKLTMVKTAKKPAARSKKI
jgi:hypothetical protein